MENLKTRKFFRRHKNIIAVLVIVIAFTLVLSSCAENGSGELISSEFPTDETASVTPGESASPTTDVVTTALPGFTDEEIDQLKTKLAEAHAALEQANAAYAAEKEAREADRTALENAQGKVAELMSEKNKLLAELGAKEVELKQKTPPELDFKSIQGMYEGYGELVTLTYSYEVTVEATQKGNFLTNKTLLYSIPGTLKMGVNFDKVKNGIAVNNATKTVTVTIPSAYFVSNEINESHVQRYDVNRGIFSKVEDKDYLNVASAAKEKAEEQVRNNGMLQYAQRLAGLEFIGLLEPVTSKSGYQIVVVYE